MNDCLHGATWWYHSWDMAIATPPPPAYRKIVRKSPRGLTGPDGQTWRVLLVARLGH